jgi:acyl carrier protein
LRLLEELGESGIRLWVEDGRLCCSAPADRLDDTLRTRLKAEREALIALLAPSGAAEIPASAGVTRRPAGAPRALTFAQEALLPLARARRAGGIYHIPVAIDLAGTVNPNALYNAVNALHDRHEALRFCFPAEAGGPVLRPRMARITIEESVAFAGTAEGEKEGLPRELEQALRRATARPFDLERGPLWRYCVFTLAPARTILLFVFHHLIFDGFSRDVFLSELSELLAMPTIALAPPPAASPPRVQCADIAAWERQMAEGPRGQPSRVWWGERFPEFHPPASLPGLAGPPEADGSVRITFSPDLAEALRARAGDIRQPVGALALTGAALALHRVTGQNRILMCTPLANRDQPEAAEVIGYLSRLVPLSVPLPPAATASDIVAELARGLFAANGHRFLSGADMMAAPGLVRTPINHVMAAWQERRQGALRINDGPVALVPVERESADFALALQFEADATALSCQISYRGDVMGRSGALAFGDLLGEVLAAVAGDGGDRPIAELAPPLVSCDRLKTLLTGHPGVDDAAVLADEATGTLSAWVVLNEFNRTSAEELKAWIGEAIGGLLPAIELTSLAALPRTPEGAVDLKALRDSALTRRQRPFLAPQSALEETIAELWRNILWLERPVGRDEHFRDLGGHSLLAVRMLADLEQRLGRRLSAQVLAKLGTVAAFAAAIEGDDGIGDGPPVAESALDPEILARLHAYTASWKGERPFPGALIVGLNLRGKRRPLFWCLQNGTEFQQLARYIGDDQPVFGMRSGHEAMVKSPENIDRLAAHYAGEIMKTVAQGPLFIGGNCQAATIAFHVARHVVAAGREVALLILHEKMVPERYGGRVALSFGRESSRNPYLWNDDPAAEFRAHFVGDFTIDLVSGGHGQFFHEPHIFDLVEMIRRRRDQVPALEPQGRGGRQGGR